MKIKRDEESRLIFNPLCLSVIAHSLMDPAVSSRYQPNNRGDEPFPMLFGQFRSR